MSTRIMRALLSVSNKAGIVEFAQALAAMGIELLSTGGTASSLRAAGVKVRDVSELTGFPEIMDGRVKTLHPKVHGGLLKRRGNLKHEAEATTNGIGEIDLLVVNLYPFEETVAKPGCIFADAIEQIDIGGPAMLRSAAKNSEFVTVVCDPGDYAGVLAELRANDGNTLLATRMQLAVKVFFMTSRYDAAICSYLSSGEGKCPPNITLQATHKQSLRYGENPHQKDAALFTLPFDEPCVAHGRQVSGKEIGFNNLQDMNAAFEVVKEFKWPAACIVKHCNPCGVAEAHHLLEAYCAAYSGDPISAFGGVLSMNGTLDERIASEIMGVKGFKLDAIVVPAITPSALNTLTTAKKWGKDVIIVETGGQLAGVERILLLEKRAMWRELRTIPGGVLTQYCDRLAHEEEFANLKIMTKRESTAEELVALKFAWVVCKHVKSNAIVLGRGNTIVGVGAGQMSRVDSVEISIKKAGDRARGAVLASDAFFPFPDGPEAAAKAGVTAIIQPGGSQKDSETIAVCNKYNIAMVFTGIRHFRH